MVRELLEYRPDWVESLFALPEWMVRWPSQKWPAGLEVVTVSNHELSRLSLLKTPGNMGTLLRLADWFGISTVICSPNCVEVFNPKVIQASMGAFLRVQTLTADFEAVINQVPEITVFGADMEGQNVFQADLPETGVLVIGNEGAGITPAIMEKVTHRVSIPKGAGGGAESLNAAVAAGIIIGVLGNQG